MIYQPELHAEGSPFFLFVLHDQKYKFEHLYLAFLVFIYGPEITNFTL